MMMIRTSIYKANLDTISFYKVPVTRSFITSFFSKRLENFKQEKKRLNEEAKAESLQREKDLWRGYQSELLQYSVRKRAATEQYHMIKEAEDKLRQEAQEEAVRNELLKRLEKSPKDLLDEEYFKDYSRFDKQSDERDPLFKGVKDTGSDDWREILKEKLQETKANFEEMKQSQPFTYTGASTETGRFGYKTVSVGGVIVYGIIGVAVFLISSELWYNYQENKQEKEAYKQLMVK